MNLKSKSKKRIVIGYFLRSLLDKMQWENNVDTISLKWLKIYNKEDLKNIVKWLFMQKVPEEINVDSMDEQELLDTIGDEYHILSYLIDEMESELKAYETPTDQALAAILEQLSHETHYLASKPIKDWDGYDLSNYQSLASKAGNPIPLYGVYDADVKEEDKYIVTLPNTFYESYRKALQFISETVEKGQFNENELKIVIL
jgi:hypothetical protein